MSTLKVAVISVLLEAAMSCAAGETDLNVLTFDASDQTGTLSPELISQAIRDAVAAGAKVINLSFGTLCSTLER